MQTSVMVENRRKFLRYLALSPVLASRLLGRNPPVSDSKCGQSDPTSSALESIKSAQQVLDVMEFEALARNALPPAHFAYLATGVDDDATVRLNHDAYQEIEIRARRLVNVEKLDCSVELFGGKWETPIFLCPVSSMKAFNAEGEVAVARAAANKRHLLMLSTVASSSIEEVSSARGGPVWQQLYPTNDWAMTRAIIKRAEAVGSPVLVFTIDHHENAYGETLFRARRIDKRDCSLCHESGFAGYIRDKPMLRGADISKVTELYDSSFTWDFVKRLKDATTMKLVLKGIVTREDAEIALQNGVDGLVVSNHGGRAEDTLRPTIECLPEVVAAVKGKIPVLVDGGIRRGTDIFKALALGATAVGFGRPQAWGLAAFGQSGVEAVLTLLRREFEKIMQQAGTPSIRQITPKSVIVRGFARPI
jgi:isopentenyl diphosphate isomerase/L-lactate dehydrogenase-like FMN-dependent dehydrogenase